MNTFKEKFTKATRRRDDRNFFHFHEINSGYTETEEKNLGLKKYKQQLAYLLKDMGVNDKLKISTYYDQLNFTYNKLADDASRNLLVEIMAYLRLGYGKVKLPLCNEDFINGINRIKELTDCSEVIDPNFLNWKLCKYDLNPLGYDIRLFFVPSVIYIDFVLKQYEYVTDKVKIKVEEGDVVIDAGGCWGDTALYFAHEAGRQGKVFVFEFIPGNLKIMKRNLELNPGLNQRINIVPNPVWKTSGDKMYFNDMGPASTVAFAPTESNKEMVTTLTIDDLVAKENIQKLDFIKMDIEGAEMSALTGAIESIKRFKPKLAVCVYHSLTDFFEIPKLIDSLGLGYKFYLGHYTHTASETVLYAVSE